MSKTRSRGALRSLILTTGMVAVVVVVAAGFAIRLVHNPFRTVTVDHSPPPVLVSLQKIAEFHAARGNFEVLVDVEHDVKYVPAALAGKRVLFTGVGSVDAYVDFSRLDPGSVQVSKDGTRVAVVLPAPELGQPTIDPSQSKVVDVRKGLLDRLGDLVSGRSDTDQGLYVAASAKMTDAARASQLDEVGKDNTRQMLEGLLHGLGYASVDVTFLPASNPSA